MDAKHTGTRAEIPGGEPLVLTRLLLDFTGTLSCDGVLLPGVAQRLKQLGQDLRITALTALNFVNIALEELNSGHMRGYGELNQEAAAGLDDQVVQMQRTIARITERITQRFP